MAYNVEEINPNSDVIIKPGQDDDNYLMVDKIEGVDVDLGTPTNGHVLTYNSTGPKLELQVSAGDLGNDAAEGYYVEAEPLFYSSIIQGNWEWVADSTQKYGGRWTNQSGDQLNDEINYDVYLIPGTYNFRMLVMKTATGGIATIKIDGSTIGTYNFSGTLTKNILAEYTGVIIATTGFKTLNIKVTDSDNPQYEVFITQMYFQRTGS